MAANSFIASGKGFFKSSTFDPTTKTTISNWTNKLREAKRFTSSSAEKFIQNASEPMFVFRPWEEELQIDKKYKVVERSNGWDKPKSWVVEPHYTPSNDLEFLKSKGQAPENVYSFEEATEIAKSKNQEIIDFLQKQI
jgi:hypothetical protein